MTLKGQKQILVFWVAKQASKHLQTITLGGGHTLLDKT